MTRPSAPPAEDPERTVLLGLPLLVIVGAVVLRAGLIPAHVWAARFVGAISSLAVPAALSWPAVGFILVALTWSQAALGSTTAAGPVEHLAIVIIATASIGFGGLAAMLHDDLEHVLGYSIVQDAGIALLAFASLRPETSDAARDWLVAAAALKTALAAWVATMQHTFGAHRLGDLSGWARRVPILGSALLLLTVGAVGLPGMAAFDARAVLVFGAVPPPLGWLVLVAALSPVAYLGRLLVTGLTPGGDAVTAVHSAAPRWVGARPGGWSGWSAGLAIRDVPVLIHANRTPIAAGATFLLAVIGLVVALVATRAV